jgi:hypothetical protein
VLNLVIVGKIVWILIAILMQPERGHRRLVITMCAVVVGNVIAIVGGVVGEAVMMVLLQDIVLVMVCFIR